jgi:hypothetical protein
MRKFLKVSDVLIPISAIVWIEKIDDETLAIYTTRTGDGGAGFDIASVKITSDSTQATLNAFNETLVLAGSAKASPRTIFELTQATSVTIA